MIRKGGHWRRLDAIVLPVCFPRVYISMKYQNISGVFSVKLGHPPDHTGCDAGLLVSVSPLSSSHIVFGARASEDSQTALRLRRQF